MVRLLHHSDLEGVYDDPDRVGRLVGRLRSLDGPDAVVCGTGDDLAPGVLALVERGRQALDLFDAAGTAVETFGNHDFDFGTERALSLVREAAPTWLSTNVRRDGGRFGADAGVRRSLLRETDGTTVGFLGLTDPDTAAINPKAAGLTFTDPVDATRRAAADLRDRGAEYVVVLSHLGAGDEALARATDVDAVLGGHVHSRRVDEVAGTLLTRPGAGGRAVAEVDLAAAEARLHDADGPVASNVAERFRGRAREAGLDEQVARVSEPVPRDDATTFGGECRVGNFVAEAFRAVGDADVGLVNSGGLRSGDPLYGAVTRADLVGLLPFEEPLTVAAVSGARLRGALSAAHGESLGFGEPDWWHAHLAGARVTYDTAAGRVQELRVGGVSVDPDATYEVALPDFLLRTDREFPALGPQDREREGPVQYEALVTYARDHGIDAETDGRVRVTGTAVAPDEPTGVVER
ncbi:MAG: bifunctional UDP-sugar hydrolase/5'-nucleotidase [Haloferacaceae archaeon]